MVPWQGLGLGLGRGSYVERETCLVVKVTELKKGKAKGQAGDWALHPGYFRGTSVLARKLLAPPVRSWGGCDGKGSLGRWAGQAPLGGEPSGPYQPASLAAPSSPRRQSMEPDRISKSQGPG